MITPVYVDPVNGSDSNVGDIANPVQTIQIGYNLVDAGGELILTKGTYDINSSPSQSFIGTHKSLTITGVGRVIVYSASGGVFYTQPSSFGSSFTLRLRNLVFRGFDSVMQVEFGIDINTLLDDFTYSVYADNVFIDRPILGGNFIRHDTVGTGHVKLQNCTFRNIATIFNDTNPSANGTIVELERNNFYDNFTSFSGAGPVMRMDRDYNAYDGNTEPHGIDTTSILRTDIYTDPANDDYSPNRASSPLIAVGEFGDTIGASYYASFSIPHISIINPDWTGWISDPSYSVPGSTSVLNVEEWSIRGGGSSGRLLSPVFTIGGTRFYLRGIDWWAYEDETFIVDNVQPTFPQKDIEYRASNMPFNQTDSTTGDIEWTFIEKYIRLNIAKAYWQIRLVLRNNG